MARFESLCLLLVACYSLADVVTARTTVKSSSASPANFSDKYEEFAVNSSSELANNASESFDGWTSLSDNASLTRDVCKNCTFDEQATWSASGNDSSSTPYSADSRSTEDYSLGTTQRVEEDEGGTATSERAVVKRDDRVEDLRERGSSPFTWTSPGTPANIVGESTATVTVLKFDAEDKEEDRSAKEVSSKEASNQEVALIEDTKRADNAMNDLDDAEDRYGAVYPYLNHRQFLRERYWPIYRRHPYNNYLRYPIFPGR